MAEDKKPPRFDFNHIALLLDRTAQNYAYHGSALLAAKQIGGFSPEQMQGLERWLNGTANSTDHIRLHEIANELRQREATRP